MEYKYTPKTKEELISAIEKEIDTIADDQNALADPDRERLVAAAKRNILAVQRDEEFFIREANESGTIIQRRHEAAPEAVLCVEEE
jgi:hypothetical protein